MSLRTVLLASVATIALLAGTGVRDVAYSASIPVANSYSDLLDPVPDAQTRLLADNFRRERAKGIEVAQEYSPDDHHHHHYHHHYRDREWYLANGYSWDGYRWVIRRRDVHHHHHYQPHHHHYN